MQDTQYSMQDVFWFPGEDQWYYRYQLYEEDVDISKEFLVFKKDTLVYSAFFRNLIDYNE